VKQYLQVKHIQDEKKGEMLTRIDGKSIRVRDSLPFFRAEDRSAGRGVGRSSAQILRRPTDGLTQSGRSMERPIGVAQQLAAKKHEVGLALSHDGIGHYRVGNQTHG
jgi:hypothetical protein